MRRLRRGRHRRRRRAGAPDAPRVRAAPLSGAEQEPRRLARPAAGARLGLRAARRDTLGRRARRPPAQQAAAPPAARSRRSSASATGSSIDSTPLSSAFRLDSASDPVRLGRRRSRRIPMAEREQTYKNHTRLLPPFHFFVDPGAAAQRVRERRAAPRAQVSVGRHARCTASSSRSALLTLGVPVADSGADGAGPRDPPRDAAAAARGCCRRICSRASTT